MKILITDDEPLARQRLERMISQIGEHEILQAENGLEAVNLCNKHRFDLVLLDIRMPEMDGLEAALHLLKLDEKPAIAFVTAYDEHALQAFKVNAVDYLLKPAKADDIAALIERLQTPTRLQLQQFQQLTPELNQQRQHISARLGAEVQLIPIKDIFYFHADQKYVNVKHKKGEALIEEPHKAIESELGQDFVRIHRNALVNIQFIKGLHKHSDGRLLCLIKELDHELEVSRRHASEIRKLIKKL